MTQGVGRRTVIDFERVPGTDRARARLANDQAFEVAEARCLARTLARWEIAPRPRSDIVSSAEHDATGPVLRVILTVER